MDSTPLAISTAEGHQTSPAVVGGMGYWFVVWEDTRGAGSMDIHGARVMPDGQVADPEGIAIGTGAAAQRHPAVTFNDRNWLVVWMDEGSDASGDIHGARVSMEGVVLEASGLAINAATGSQDMPVLASNGDGWLVVWRNIGSRSELRGARVTSAGRVLDTSGFAIGSRPQGQYYPAVASDGLDYLVVWNEIGSGQSDVYGARVLAMGQVLDSTGFPLSNASYGESHPSIASAGPSGYLVTYSRVEDGKPQRIRARLVSFE